MTACLDSGRLVPSEGEGVQDVVDDTGGERLALHTRSLPQQLVEEKEGEEGKLLGRGF